MPTRRDLIADVVGGLQRIVRAVHTFSRQSLVEHGVTGPQLWALRALATSDGLTVGELAGRMYLHISTVSSLLDRLCGRGLVLRSRDLRDRRVVRLAITPAGKALVRRAPEPPRSKLPGGLERLRGAELHQMSRALSRLAQIMELTESDGMYFEDWTPTPRRPARSA